MHKSKKKRLQSKGWKFGTVKEFLNLSQEDSSYIEIKLRLSDYLKKRRKKTRLTQEKLARIVSSSQSRVAKMESGDPSVSLDLLIRSLLAMGTSKSDLGKIISKPKRSTAT